MKRPPKDTALRLAAEEMERAREMLAPCMQCGSCTASCPQAEAMRAEGTAPRQLWRLALLGSPAEVFGGGAFWLCSACYRCTARCPRGLPLTRVMGVLKRAARLAAPETARKNAAFYTSFMDNIQTYGRVQETELMLRWFLAMRDPILPLAYAPLGMKMLRRGKVHAPSGDHKGRLAAMFAKAAELQGEDRV